MTGKIIEISTAEGTEVKAGDIVVTMEAMKMEYRVESPRDGVVEKVWWQPKNSSTKAHSW